MLLILNYLVTMKKYDAEKAKKIGNALASFAWSKQGKKAMVEHMKKARANRWTNKTPEERKAFCANLRSFKGKKADS